MTNAADELKIDSEETEMRTVQSSEMAIGWQDLSEEHDDDDDGDDDDDDDDNDDNEVVGSRSMYFEDDLVFINHRERLAERNISTELPETVQVLKTSENCIVYLVGTAHFSESSQQDVRKVMKMTQPDVVLVELCSSRINILSLDEETLLREARDMSVEKMRATIKQSGLIQGILHMLLLSMSAHITKQLGMAPGGEFRAAFREAKNIPGCRVHLGDRPISITLQRALGSLSWAQKLRLAWYLITSKDSISKEDVERCKQKDLLEEMLREMTGEFPALSRVFVTERDLFLANSLHRAAQPLIDPHTRSKFIPSVVVGVVGIGHVPGIVSNWDKTTCDVSSLLTVPPRSLASSCTRWMLRTSVAGVMIYGSFRLFKFFITSGSIDLLRPAAAKLASSSSAAASLATERVLKSGMVIAMIS